jgi:hypothetical protein
MVTLLFASISLLASQISPTTNVADNKSPTSPALATAGHDITSIGQVGVGTGWALVDQHLFWTANDGKAWTDITPSSSAHIDGVHFIDRKTGWVVMSQGDDYEESNTTVNIATTSDGGATWELSALALNGEGRRYSHKASVFFLDGQHGWITLRLSSGSNFSFGILVSTSDGGATWSRLPDPPVAESVSFATPTNGWIVGGPAGDALWNTRDGGKSWKKQKVRIPKDCAVCRPIYGRPKFQTREDGVLPVTLVSPNHVLTGSYLTHDGGRSWKLENINEQPLKSFRNMAAVIVGSSVLRFQANQGAIARISETGQATVSALPPSLWPAGGIVDLTFSSSTQGWLVYSAGKCTGFKTRCSEQLELLSIRNAGASYEVVTPHPSGLPSQIALAGTPLDDVGSGLQSPIPLSPDVQVSQGEGFDMACVSTASDMLTWWQYSPYYDTGVYIGGSNITCKTNTYLNPTWINSVSGNGWGIMPLWVGLQSPCIANSNNFWTISETQAYNEGERDADAAMGTASSLGVGSSIIYFDMEYYTPGSKLKDGTACSPLVLQFIQGWADELHSSGYLAGLYGSLGDWWTASGGAQDFIQLSGEIDDVWISDGNSNNDSVWNLGSLPNSYWSNNQRIHQYILGEASETWGGVTLGPPPNQGIDRDVEDAPVFSWGGDRNLSAPTLLAPVNGASQVPTTPTFTWTPVTGAVSGGGSGYRIMVATAPSLLPTDPSVSSCSGCVIDYPSPSDPNLMTNSYTPPAGVLYQNVTYWWQVQARPQTPKLGDWSSQSDFSTGIYATSIQSLTIQPTTIGNGSYAVVTATLNGLAVTGGQVVTLKSNNAAFPVPAQVTVSSGQTGASLNILAGSVSTQTTITVTGSFNGSQSGSVVLSPSGAIATTTQASPITDSTAVITGTINPQNDNGAAYFEWGTDPNLASPNTNCYYWNWWNCPVAANSTSQTFTYSLTGLVSGTVYYFRMVFYDANGNFTKGAIKSFSTLSPAVTTVAASSVRASGAVLNGTINPQNDNGAAYFEWGTDPTLSSPNTTCYYWNWWNCPVAANATKQPFVYAISGLTSGYTYYFRMVFYDANNGLFQKGAVLSFTTTIASITTSCKKVTQCATSITGSSGTLNGTVNPQGDNGAEYFEWGTDPTLSSPNTTCYYWNWWNCPVAANTSKQSFSYSLTGLQNDTTYYLRMVFYDASNGRVIKGVLASFTTATPAVSTSTATSPTASSAILNGTINPQADNGAAYFEWGTDPNLTNPNTTCYYPNWWNCPVAANSTKQAFTYSLTGLTSATTYYFRMVFYDANNGVTTKGAIKSFKTLTPVATTSAASSITANTAVLNGAINPQDDNGAAYFEWGTDSNLTNPNMTCYYPNWWNCPVAASANTQSFSSSLTGLAAATTYYYRMVFFDANNGGFARGSIVSFATPMMAYQQPSSLRPKP